MNRKKWDSLPHGVQKAFEATSSEWIPKAAEVWETADEQAKGYVLKMGNEIIPLSKEENARWAKAVEPLIEEYEKMAESKGLPGKEYTKEIKGMIGNYKGK
jgi:TRAP-type C4-dicarboxylate transport system substrate-binding protein